MEAAGPGHRAIVGWERGSVLSPWPTTSKCTSLAIKGTRQKGGGCSEAHLQPWKTRVGASHNISASRSRVGMAQQEILSELGGGGGGRHKFRTKGDKGVTAKCTGIPSPASPITVMESKENLEAHELSWPGSVEVAEKHGEPVVELQ